MACAPCQFALNVALTIDKAANTLLLGDPNETLSRRFGRAADAGSWIAKAVCWLLSLISARHCYWAEQPGTSGAEIWHWSNNDSEPVL